MKKPGDKDTIKWHVKDLLVGEEAPGALDISTEVSEPTDLAKQLKRHDVVVVTAVGDTKVPGKKAGRATAATEAVRAAAQRLTLDGRLAAEVKASGFVTGEASSEAPPKKGAKRWRRARERSRVGFLILRGTKVLEAHGLTEGTITAFVQRQPQAGAKDLNLDDLPDEDQIAKVLEQVLSPALRTATELAANTDKEL